jgi:hypothetical protein
MEQVSLRDFFASQAMSVVMQETQEMKTASFKEWIKHLLVVYLNFSFLEIKYVQIEGVYEDAAKRAYEYADALLAARESKVN